MDLTSSLIVLTLYLLGGINSWIAFRRSSPAVSPLVMQTMVAAWPIVTLIVLATVRRSRAL